MLDIVPLLNEDIQKSFNSYCIKDTKMIQVSRRIRDGTATFIDAHRYSERLGENLSRALINNLTADKLPNGTLYYNIAQRTVIPGLEQNYIMVNDISKEVQSILDEESGIGLKAVTADFPKARINGLIDKMTSDEMELEEAVKWLKEPIVNNTEAFFDDYIKSNAEFRSSVGLKATITRTVFQNCCDWCADLAGVYDYRDAPQDIYRRHEFCRCSVTYQSGKQSQNVWTKKTWQSTTEELDRRKSVGLQSEMTSRERIEAVNQAYRDRNVKKFASETGANRSYARSATLKKNPSEIEAAIAKYREQIEEKARR